MLYTNSVNLYSWTVFTGSKLPSALPTFLDSMQEDSMVEEDQAERSEQGRVPEELATLYSTQDQAMMQDCYSKIVEKLSIANPAMVLQVPSCLEPLLPFHWYTLISFPKIKLINMVLHNM